MGKEGEGICFFLLQEKLVWDSANIVWISESLFFFDSFFGRCDWLKMDSFFSVQKISRFGLNILLMDKILHHQG